MYQADEKRYEEMKYNRCGASGLLLPAVSLGLWHNFGSNGNFDNMLDMCHTAFDHGITHFDLANNYGPVYGAAEENFGRILKKDAGTGFSRPRLVFGKWYGRQPDFSAVRNKIYGKYAQKGGKRRFCLLFGSFHIRMENTTRNDNRECSLGRGTSYVKSGFDDAIIHSAYGVD